MGKTELDTEALKSLCSLELKYDVRILSIRIIGRRWSNEGDVPRDIPVGPAHRLQIDDSSGFMIYGWHLLSNDNKDSLITDLKEYHADK